MRGQDRFLLGIVAGIVILTAVGLGLAFTRQTPGYRPDDSPENVTYNFLLAVRQDDFDRAYGYLSPTLPGYPARDEIEEDINRSYWNMLNSRSAINIETSPAEMTGDEAVVEGRVIIYSQPGPFWWQDYSYDVAFTSQLEQVNGDWKLVGGSSYWVDCWNNNRGCSTR